MSTPTQDIAVEVEAIGNRRARVILRRGTEPFFADEINPTRADDRQRFVETVKTKFPGLADSAADIETELIRRAGMMGKHEEPKQKDAGQGQELKLRDFEPWDSPVGGPRLLDKIAAGLRRHVALPPHADTALALWAVWSHAIELFDCAPRLALLSAQKRSGKTLTLSLLWCLVPRPLLAANISPAATFRTIAAARPVLLIDEVDSFLTNNEDMRGLLNSGHTRASANVVRTVGENYEPRQFSTWTPIALAGIGNLPETLMDRSIIIRMRRRAPNEQVERFTSSRHTPVLEVMGREAARWIADYEAELRAADPVVPGELSDRAADSWRPLLAVADTAGESWPARGRAAAVALSGNGDAQDESIAVKLLADIRMIFMDREVDSISSADLCAALAEREDCPWQEFSHGEAISARQLARLLHPFGIGPKSVRIGGQTPKGYAVEDFADAWSRYLSPVLSATAQQARNGAGSLQSISATRGGIVADENQGKGP